MQAITTYTTQSQDIYLYPIEMTIKCGCDVYSFSKKTLEEDFVHFATLFPEGHNELDPEYSRGWKVLFTHWKDCYHWSYDDLQEFHQLLYCVLKAGSKKWLDALKGYRFYCLSPEYSKVSGVLKEFQKECQNVSTSFNCNDLLHGLNESFVQEILKQNFSPNEYEIFQILVFHGKQVRALYLPAISDALIPWLRVFFSNLESLCSIVNHRFQSLVSECQHLQILRLQLGDVSKVSLSQFEHCQNLRELSLECHPNAPRMQIHPFERPHTFTSLQTLSLKMSLLSEPLLTSLTKLPALSRLDLSYSIIYPIHDLQALTSCSVLKVLEFAYEKKEKYSRGALHFLSKKTPKLEFQPGLKTIPEFHYRDIIIPSSNQKSEYIFSSSDIENDSLMRYFINRTRLSNLLQKAKKYDLYWPAQIGLNNKNISYNYGPRVPYNHNMCHLPFYFNASPIDCPDGKRLRIATQEPFNAVTKGDFWEAVKMLDISLIVMARDDGGSYLPSESNPACVFTGQNGNPITVSLIKSETLAHKIIRRCFRVSDKEIIHIQVPWKDMCGLDEDVLCFLVDLIEVEEQGLSGGTCVHCAAGFGRTGTVFGAMIISQLLHQVQKGALLNMKALVFFLRFQRMSMILTDDQLNTLLGFFKKKS